MAKTKNRDDQLFTAPVTHKGQVTHDGAVVNNGSVINNGSVVRPARQLIITAADGYSFGGAPWIQGAFGLATLGANSTNSVLIVPIKGLFIGDTVTGVRVTGQVESAGANVTLVMSVRKTTAAAADFVDVELGTANVGTLVADTLISGTVLEVLGLSETIDALEVLYVKLTGTTAALTDIAVASIIVDVNQN